jgi:hypothetical protein
MSIDNPKMLDLRDSAQRKKPASNNTSQRKKIYAPSNKNKKELQNINQPIKKQVKASSQGNYRWLIIIIALIAVGFIVYKYGINRNQPKTENTASQSTVTRWYSVKLVDGETYYGQVGDLKANPIKMDKVYYNYDATKTTDTASNPTGTATGNEAGSIRLVKRGKETHGPTGEMFIYQAQIVDVEPLADDSKVLKAILDNEK